MGPEEATAHAIQNGILMGLDAILAILVVCAILMLVRDWQNPK
jgi:hypothetical protein